MKLMLTFIVLLSVNMVFGQSEEEHQIDIELRGCLNSDENYTTKAMTSCVLTATKQWDDELNKKYQELLPLLTKDQKKMMKNSQRQWINYRDSEMQFSNKLYTDMQGTMWIPISAETKLELTKQRTLELSGYITNLTFDN